MESIEHIICDRIFNSPTQYNNPLLHKIHHMRKQHAVGCALKNVQSCYLTLSVKGKDNATLNTKSSEVNNGSTCSVGESMISQCRTSVQCIVNSEQQQPQAVDTRRSRSVSPTYGGAENTSLHYTMSVESRSLDEYDKTGIQTGQSQELEPSGKSTVASKLKTKKRAALTKNKLHAKKKNGQRLKTVPSGKSVVASKLKTKKRTALTKIKLHPKKKNLKDEKLKSQKALALTKANEETTTTLSVKNLVKIETKSSRTQADLLPNSLDCILNTADVGRRENNCQETDIKPNSQSITEGETNIHTEEQFNYSDDTATNEITDLLPNCSDCILNTADVGRRENNCQETDNKSIGQSITEGEMNIHKEEQLKYSDDTATNEITDFLPNCSDCILNTTDVDRRENNCDEKIKPNGQSITEGETNIHTEEQFKYSDDTATKEISGLLTVLSLRSEKVVQINETTDVDKFPNRQLIKPTNVKVTNLDPRRRVSKLDTIYSAMVVVPAKKLKLNQYADDAVQGVETIKPLKGRSLDISEDIPTTSKSAIEKIGKDTSCTVKYADVSSVARSLKYSVTDLPPHTNLNQHDASPQYSQMRQEDIQKPSLISLQVQDKTQGDAENPLAKDSIIEINTEASMIDTTLGTPSCKQMVAYSIEKEVEYKSSADNILQEKSIVASKLKTKKGAALTKNKLHPKKKNDQRQKPVLSGKLIVGSKLKTKKRVALTKNKLHPKNKKLNDVKPKSKKALVVTKANTETTKTLSVKNLVKIETKSSSTQKSILNTADVERRDNNCDEKIKPNGQSTEGEMNICTEQEFKYSEDTASNEVNSLLTFLSYEQIDCLHRVHKIKRKNDLMYLTLGQLHNMDICQPEMVLALMEVALGVNMRKQQEDKNNQTTMDTICENAGAFHVTGDDNDTYEEGLQSMETINNNEEVIDCIIPNETEQALALEYEFGIVNKIVDKLYIIKQQDLEPPEKWSELSSLHELLKSQDRRIETLWNILLKLPRSDCVEDNEKCFISDAVKQNLTDVSESVSVVETKNNYPISGGREEDQMEVENKMHFLLPSDVLECTLGSDQSELSPTNASDEENKFSETQAVVPFGAQRTDAQDAKEVKRSHIPKVIEGLAILDFLPGGDAMYHDVCEISTYQRITKTKQICSQKEVKHVTSRKSFQATGKYAEKANMQDPHKAITFKPSNYKPRSLRIPKTASNVVGHLSKVNKRSACNKKHKSGQKKALQFKEEITLKSTLLQSNCFIKHTSQKSNKSNNDQEMSLQNNNDSTDVALRKHVRKDAGDVSDNHEKRSHSDEIVNQSSLVNDTFSLEKVDQINDTTDADQFTNHQLVKPKNSNATNLDPRKRVSKGDTIYSAMLVAPAKKLKLPQYADDAMQGVEAITTLKGSSLDISENIPTTSKSAIAKKDVKALDNYLGKDTSCTVKYDDVSSVARSLKYYVTDLPPHTNLNQHDASPQYSQMWQENIQKPSLISLQVQDKKQSDAENPLAKDSIIEINTEASMIDTTLGTPSCKQMVAYSIEKEVEYKSSAENITARAPTAFASYYISSPSPVNSEIGQMEAGSYRFCEEIDGRMTYPPLPYTLLEVDLTRNAFNEPVDINKLVKTNGLDPRIFRYRTKICNVTNASSLMRHQSYGTSTPFNSDLTSSSISNDLTHRPQSFEYQSSLPSPSLQPSTQNAIVGYTTNSTSSSALSYPAPMTALANSEAPLFISDQEQNQVKVFYNCLHVSPWYQSLMPSMRIQINQSISHLLRALNYFQRQRQYNAEAVFDIFTIDGAGEIIEILSNLGLMVETNGAIVKDQRIPLYGPRFSATSVPQHAYSSLHHHGSAAANSHDGAQCTSLGTASSTSFRSTSSLNEPFASCYREEPASMAGVIINCRQVLPCVSNLEEGCCRPVDTGVCSSVATVCSASKRCSCVGNTNSLNSFEHNSRLHKHSNYGSQERSQSSTFHTEKNYRHDRPFYNQRSNTGTRYTKHSSYTDFDAPKTSTRYTKHSSYTDLDAPNTSTRYTKHSSYTDLDAPHTSTRYTKHSSYTDLDAPHTSTRYTKHSSYTDLDAPHTSRRYTKHSSYTDLDAPNTSTRYTKHSSYTDLDAPHTSTRYTKHSSHTDLDAPHTSTRYTKHSSYTDLDAPETSTRYTKHSTCIDSDLPSVPRSNEKFYQEGSEFAKFNKKGSSGVGFERHSSSRPLSPLKEGEKIYCNRRGYNSNNRNSDKSNSNWNSSPSKTTLTRSPSRSSAREASPVLNSPARQQQNNQPASDEENWD